MKRLRKFLLRDRGSAPVEFVMTGILLSLITLGVLQLSLSVYVRNTVIDAVAEGARYASLADHNLSDGIVRSRELISASLGPGFEVELRASQSEVLGSPAIRVDAVAALPVLGIWGVFGTMEVHAVSARELRH
ncbi:MAG: TadE family protein [Microbacteriaceae bacterium]